MVNWYVWTRVLFVSMSGFVFGYDVGSINGVKDMRGYRAALNLSYQQSVDDQFSTDNLSSGQESCSSDDDLETSAILGLIVALMSVGSLIGALMSGFLSDFAGRKPAVITGGSLVAIGGLLHTGAVHLWMALLSRILIGFGLGILYQVTPLYVGEISPEKLRGRLLSFLNIYATVGYLVGTILNLIVKDYLFGWRISVGIQFLMGTLLALGMLLLPRSPRWLVKRERKTKALAVLTKIYQDRDRAQVQLEEIQSAASLSKGSLVQNLKYMFQWNVIQRLLLGFFILLLGRFAGGNFIAYFSVSLLCGIGLPGFAVSLAIAASQFVAMFISLSIIDKLGRKPLFLFGTLTMLVSHITSATLIVAFNLEDSAMDIFSTAQTVAAYFVMVSMCLFLSGFALSCGNVPWIIMGELFPLKARGLMISLCNTAFWVGIIAINQISPVLVSSPLKISGTLWLFSAVILVLFFYILLALPETKGETLESMEKIFSKPWLERANVLFYLRCGCLLELFRSKTTVVLEEDSEDKQPLTGDLSLQEENLDQSVADSDTVTPV